MSASDDNEYSLNNCVVTSISGVRNPEFFLDLRSTFEDHIDGSVQKALTTSFGLQKY